MPEPGLRLGEAAMGPRPVAGMACSTTPTPPDPENIIGL